VTASAAEREGFHVDYTAQEHTGEALARELAGSLAGCSVLVPRGDRADDRLPNALRRIGARVTEVVAYRTTAPQSADARTIAAIGGGEVDAMVFTSPSAFHNLTAFLGANELRKLSETARFAAIGPTTASTMRDAGVSVKIEAEESSAAGLADAIAKHFSERSVTARPA